MQDSQAKLGTEEDADCNDNGCTGILEMVPDGDCSCHMNPPCPACENCFLECTICGREHHFDD